MRTLNRSLPLFALMTLMAGPGAGKTFAAGVAPRPQICQRACWGAAAPQGGISTISSLTRAIVHHTAIQGDYNTTSLETSKANVRAVQSYHMDVNGWSDIGYHFLCDKLGNIFEGRSGSMSGLPRGAHDGTNANSFGFNVMGYYHTPYNQVPTVSSMEALASLIAWRMPSTWAGPYGYPTCTYGPLGNCVGYIDSHRRVKATACPGDKIHTPWIGNDPSTGTLRAMVQQWMDGTVCAVPVPATPGALSATAVSFSQVDLTWTDRSVNEDGFYVYRSTDSGNAYAKVGERAAGATTFSDTTAAPGTTYFYIVTAHNCGGESTGSAEASARTPLAIGSVQGISQRVRVMTAGTGWQILAYYYGSGRSVVSPYSESAGTAEYQLETENWAGLFLYDYSTAAFTQAMYVVNLTL